MTILPFSTKTGNALDKELATVADILEIDPAGDNSNFVVLAYPKHGSWNLSFDDGRYQPVYRSDLAQEFAVRLATKAALAWGATLIVQNAPWPECRWTADHARGSHAAAVDYDDPVAAFLPAHLVRPARPQGDDAGGDAA